MNKKTRMNKKKLIHSELGSYINGLAMDLTFSNNLDYYFYFIIRIYFNKLQKVTALRQSNKR